MKLLKKIDCTDKKVLVRVDLNIDLKETKEAHKSLRFLRIQESVSYILGFSGARVALVTHLGRPGGKADKRYSTEVLQKGLEAIFQEKISFTPDCLNSDDFTEARIALRENVRFYPEEEQNDPLFAEKLSRGFDIYVNEAFSVSHRNHASVVAITDYLPSVAGFNLEEEVTALKEALTDPLRPAVAILGGAKIETKLPLIRVFEERYDTVLLGGSIANEALDQNISLKENVFMPVDFRGEERFDIGDETIKKYREVIASAKTIVWNGPLGKFEEPPYDTGTFAIIEALKQSPAKLIAGGGESWNVIEKAGAASRFDVLSSGGGAMLAYLSGEPMPALLKLE